MFLKIKLFLKEYFTLIFSIFLILITFFIFSFIVSFNNKLKVVFLDIGQGDSIFIKSPVGNKVLIDGGPGDNLVKRLPKYMSLFDRDIDMIFITNPDKDHFEGFIPLLENYNVPVFITSGVSAPNNPVYQEFIRISKKNGLKELQVLNGQIIDIGGGAYLEVIFPDREGLSDLSHNDGSLVLRLVYGKTSILFTGDSTEKIEKYLIENYPQNLKADILKVGHHGSKTSTSDPFVSIVSPLWAVISVGKINPFGHPHKEVLDILKKYNVEILGTYDRGDIVFESDGRLLRKR
jgi:competence protein ComEC